MIDVSVSTVVKRPVAEVFAFVAEMENEPQWHTDILAAERTTDGEVGRGTRYRVQFKPQPMSPTEGAVEIVDFEPGRRIVSQSDMGNMKPTMTHEFEEVDAGTRLTRRIQIETSGALTLMNPMMRVMVRRSNAQFIENLKRLLET
ncbi:MAG TPA: SRPBCC family protein [Acidimicrobiia bacterium]|jgi:uncharacterized protein YndB with AHSA1/START domain|nr:SRPBCC family protein [Acidimicrobiia bacterium]